MADLSEEDQIFAARLEDLFRQAEEKCYARFSAFLDERQQRIAGLVGQNYRAGKLLFYGGYSEAERRMLGIFPEYQEPEPEEFPIRPVCFRFRSRDSLSHRDFLGAFMNLRLKRETIGDILIGEGTAVAFLQPAACTLVLEEIKKIGKVGVQAEEGISVPLPAAHQFEQLSGTVSSLRLDCLVAFLTRLSREKAQNLVLAGLVACNGLPVTDSASTVEQGDKIAIRGYGKFLVDEVGALSKKGRIHLQCQKYV